MYLHGKLEIENNKLKDKIAELKQELNDCFEHFDYIDEESIDE